VSRPRAVGLDSDRRERQLGLNDSERRGVENSARARCARVLVTLRVAPTRPDISVSAGWMAWGGKIPSEPLATDEAGGAAGEQLGDGEQGGVVASSTARRRNSGG
jgi:hypothetical protein